MKFHRLIIVASMFAFSASATLFADDNSMNGPAMTGPAMSGDSSMSGSNTGSADSMMAPNTMSAPDTMSADPKVGSMLRFAPSAAHKVIFTDLKTAESFAANGPTLLFFAADWCPYCQADLRDINQNGAMLSRDITVVVVNYDKESSLKAKYGVTQQDTYVQIDTMGNRLTAWNSGGVDVINKRVVRM
ncbi:MAG TPA: thioredoxin family protein [Spirochaetia bacterium]|nr:thioredoxin family protein [Spirochaetia bacterium]